MKFKSNRIKLLIVVVTFFCAAMEWTGWAALPEGWSSKDVGATIPEGNSAYHAETGAFALKGYGVGTSAKLQGYHYVYLQTDDSFQFTAHLSSLVSSKSQVKAGLMWRDGSQSSANNVILAMTSEDQLVFGKNVKWSSEEYFNHELKKLTWFRMVYHHGLLNAYASEEGAQWKWIGEIPVTSSGKRLIGLMVTSHSDTVSADALFDSVKVEYDQDHDGLYDDEERVLGTDPLKSDTDGDGRSDYQEVREFFSDPLLKDSVATGVISVSGFQAIPLMGTWTTSGSAIQSESRRGEIEFEIQAPTSDIFELDIEGKSTDEGTGWVKHPLIVTIDGQELGQVTLGSNNGHTGHAQLMTPWLNAGKHRLQILWDNTKLGHAITFTRVSLRQWSGADEDGNGVKDQVDRLLQEGNALVAPISSVVSPALIEGRATHESLLKLSAGLEPHPGPNHSWYAHLPLNAGHETWVTAQFDQGGLVKTAAVNWEPTNVWDEGHLVIRKGDSLLLYAHPVDATSGSYRLKIGDQIWWRKVGVSRICQFNQPGEFTVEGKYQNVVHKLQVTVLEVQLPPVLDSIAGLIRYFDIPVLPSGTVWAVDSRMGFSEVKATKPNSQRFGVKTDGSGSQYLLVRYGEKGPILGSIEVRSTRFSSAEKTNVDMTETYEDGSHQIDMGIVLSQPIEGLRFVVEIFVSGVMFDDGTRVREFTLDDFNELGEAAVQMITPNLNQGKACHHISIYQGDELIGYLN